MRYVHGHSPAGKRSPEYGAWRGIKKRCRPGEKYHGDLGVKYCARWRIFKNFLNDVGLRPTPKHSIDRYPDPNGDYKSSNVRWATPRQQMLNRRKTLFVILRGEKIPFGEAIHLLGLNENTARARIRLGWTAQEAISLKIRKRTKKVRQ